MIIALLLLLQLKHFVVDFLMQPRWMYEHKGTYGHSGGLAHAGLHAAVSMMILLVFVDGLLAIAIAAFEGVAHYHIDWAKVQIGKRMGWGPTTHQEFWYLLGLDQFLHQLCYVAMLVMAFGIA